MHTQSIGGVQVTAPVRPEYRKIVTPDAMKFIAHLSRSFAGRVDELLQRRIAVQIRYDGGDRPRFLPETKHIRDGNWRVAPIPPDLQDRRVEITGPTDRKMVINALNSGANVFMPDFEDSNCPTWDNMIDGQVNLYDAVRRTISLDTSGKRYKLNAGKLPVVVVRPRGWHLWEKHCTVDDHFVPGALFDFGLYFFHNAKELLSRQSGPYFYLPKMQSHLEARLWNDVFIESQRVLGIPVGTIRATCLIETLPAAFEIDEFLYELRQHSAGLNCGRWDYMFSFIKTLRTDPNRIFPDRGLVGMEQHFLRSYALLVIKTCHKRGVHAMGGMAAQIPIKNDPAANQAAVDKVKKDKLREVMDGHDGTWVAHPALIPIAKEIFDQHMKTPNQLHILRDDVNISEEDLLTVPSGPKTMSGLRNNVSVSIQYLEAWLGGNGCVPLHNLMEDAATAEISRSQVWQWLAHGASLDDGGRLTTDTVAIVIQQELDTLRQKVGDARFASGKYLDAGFLFKYMATSRELQDFLTLPAYDTLLGYEFGGAAGNAASKAQSRL